MCRELVLELEQRSWPGRTSACVGGARGSIVLEKHIEHVILELLVVHEHKLDKMLVVKLESSNDATMCANLLVLRARNRRITIVSQVCYAGRLRGIAPMICVFGQTESRRQ
jgi:hypothetical protein